MAIVTKTFTTTCPGDLRDAINADGAISPECIQIVSEGGATTDFEFVSALSGAEDTALDALLAGWSCPVVTPDDVQISDTLADNAVLRGDGGTNGIQDSAWTIDDAGRLKVASPVTEAGPPFTADHFAVHIHNTATSSGGGLYIQAGEAEDDIALRITDENQSFFIVDVHADDGNWVFGASYTDTKNTNGVVYGFDNQYSSTPDADFNTQNGTYRIGGNPIALPNLDDVTISSPSNSEVLTYNGSAWVNAPASGGGSSAPLQTYTMFADQVDYPLSGSDWNITNGAPASTDTNNSSLTVRRFDDSSEEAIGWLVNVPSDATNMTVRYKTRAESGANSVAVVRLHKRTLPDNGAIGSWTISTLSNIATTSNENWQVDETTDTLANWSMTAGEVHQMQFSRNTGSGSDVLTGDLTLLMVEVVFT